MSSTKSVRSDPNLYKAKTAKMATKPTGSIVNWENNGEDLCIFLGKRNIDKAVIRRFVDNKMDCESVAIASVADLEELGLTAKGDILAVQAFCKSRKPIENREEKKKKLIELIKGKKILPKSKLSESSKQEKTKGKDRQISLGWLHFDKTTSRYITVRAAKGGGTRYITVSVGSSKDDILSACKDLYYPKGQSIHGDISSMTVNLGNFKCMVIDSLELPDGTKCDFTLQSYINAHKLQRPRLYLMTKYKLDICDQNMETEVSDCATDDEDFPVAFSTTRETNSISNHIVIPGEMHDAIIDKDNQLKILQQDRLSRLPTEPDICEEHVLISVRHVQLGVNTRAFRPEEKMSAVYDWVGSLSAVPEYFNLYLQLPCRLLCPSEDVSVAQTQMLNMAATDEPPPLDAKDLEISLRGFGPIHQVPKRPETSKRSINNEVFNTNPPRQLLVDDSDSEDNEQGENKENAETINDQGLVPGSIMSTETMGQACSTIYIRRATIMEDMMKEFECSNILNSQVTFVMIDSRGEEEMGEDSGGISRDAYSGFWQTFYDRCTLGEDQRVPALLNDFQVVQWQSIARILVKGYLQVNYFPFLISKSFFTSMLLGETSVSEESLLDSFKEYLAKDEAQILRDVLLGSSNPDDQEVLELVDRFGCRKLPNSENIRCVFLDIAHKELVQKPQYVADCWAPICRQWLAFTGLVDIDRVYEKSHPTNKKVLSLLCSTPVTIDGEKDALDYLKRLIRGLNQQDLSYFLKFVTGSDMLCVDKITIQFTPLDGFQRRPIAHTCGAVLELPRTYQSFPELREEFSNILHQREWVNDII